MTMPLPPIQAEDHGTVDSARERPQSCFHQSAQNTLMLPAGRSLARRCSRPSKPLAAVCIE
jgi:hypothetical protein